jgi:anti-sigma regulatory factor (Ser/Thr protein kinase)
MMEELSLHILDIVENSINAGATLVKIDLSIDKKMDEFNLTITDDGKGMDEEMVKNIRDPFFTTRTTRRVGLGVSFLDEIADLTGGSLDINSTPGKGTVVSLRLPFNHPDRPPLGDIISTLMTILMTAQDTRFIYRETRDNKEWIFDSAEVTGISDPVFLKQVKDMLYNSYKEFTGGELI